jgi:hypothetical protein
MVLSCAKGDLRDFLFFPVLEHGFLLSLSDSLRICFIAGWYGLSRITDRHACSPSSQM